MADGTVFVIWSKIEYEGEPNDGSWLDWEVLVREGDKTFFFSCLLSNFFACDGSGVELIHQDKGRSIKWLVPEPYEYIDQVDYFETLEQGRDMYLRCLTNPTDVLMEMLI